MITDKDIQKIENVEKKLPELLKEKLEWVTMKAEHDRMKKILHEKLNVEV